VILRHFNGLETYHAHLSKLLVYPDQNVKSGDPIGLGGNTGHSFGPHLHFEIRFYDVPMNPEEIIDFDKKVMANINKVLNDVNPYWAAANYYYDNNKDLNQALIWADKYIEKNSYYWTLHLKAKILRKLNKNKEAIAVAEKSLALAKADGDRAYVMNNEKLIAEAKAAK
jgi:murein DD-endopeptidase MepM/ murein hydrolase activator NlpD